MGMFEQYRKMREELSEACDLVEEVWTEATDETEYEKLAGSNVGESEVLHLLSEVRRRLVSDTVEVGIFGQVKRGKSTLINALVEENISSVNILPETATPIWVESGKPRSFVIFSDGSRVEFDDAVEAAEMATQRHRGRKKEKNGEVLRVQHFREIDWLPKGLRIIDTPGLSDPSLIQEYEDRTLGELERVAAAIFVLSSPPIADKEEIRLLKSLGARGINKVFVVCNFWSDSWAEVSERGKVLSYLREIVIEGALDAGGVKPDHVHLYGVNAKMAVKAADSGDAKAYSESGVPQLRSDLEDFLSNGALVAMTASTAENLERARAVTRATLDSRRKILDNPNLLDKALRESEDAVKASQRELDQIERTLASTGSLLESTLADILAQPYESAMAELSGATKVDEAKALENSLRLRIETAATRASVEFSRVANEALRDAEKRLYDSFGAEGTFASASTSSFHGALQNYGSIGTSTLKKIDWDAVAVSSVTTGAGTGLVGGTLAGGLGTALVASGPVGWVIGAGIGLALGMLGGALAGGGITYGKLRPEERKKIADQLRESRDGARQFAKKVAAEWTTQSTRGLASKRERYLSEKSREMTRIKGIIADQSSRRDALKQLRALEARLG